MLNWFQHLIRSRNNRSASKGAVGGIHFARRLAWAFGVELLFAMSCDGSGSGGAVGRPFEGQPNIIFILTDDLDLRSIEFMPILKEKIGKRGVSFSNFFVTDSVCCPSRSSILRGQYVHNHGVLTNGAPEGGFERFLELGNERSTVGVWLHDAGYRTIFMGKYLNGYPGDDATHLPPGWDEWHGASGAAFYKNFKYKLNENGTLVEYGHDPEDYLTDVLAAKAARFIREAGTDGRPFFIHLSTAAPHQPATPAPRHRSLFAEVIAPRVPSFDEEDVSDKPGWIRRRSAIGEEEATVIDALYRLRLQSLQAVDELVGNLVDALEETGQLSRTYLFFTSDNGFHLGEHRILQGKQTAYEEAIHLPLLVRGPGVAEGRAVEDFVLNIDYAPTFAEWAGEAIPDWVDGRSIVSLLGGAGASDWRRSVLIEHWPHGGGGDIPEYGAIRTKDFLHVEYVNGDRELYDMAKDPYQLNSLHASADPSVIADLSSRLAALRKCSGASCRVADR